PQVTHLPLDRPQRQPDPLLLLELLANHISVTGVAAEPLRHPLFQPTQLPRPTAAAIGHPAALGQIPADRHVAAPQLARHPPRPTALRRTIAATSSGVCTASLRGNSPREAGCTDPSIV